MGSSMSMDPDQLKQALATLQAIPHTLNGDRSSTPIADLQDVISLPDDLRGFAVNGGSASSWIAECCTNLQTFITQLVTDVQGACADIGTQMDNSINAYQGGDTDSSGTVKNAGAPVTNAPVTSGDTRGR